MIYSTKQVIITSLVVRAKQHLKQLENIKNNLNGNDKFLLMQPLDKNK